MEVKSLRLSAGWRAEREATAKFIAIFRGGFTLGGGFTTW
jgi:hypothetical protein